jgi:phosphotriesterase-related protein
VADLVAAGHGNRVLLSCSAIGVAKGRPGHDLPYGHVLTAFAPLLAARGVADEDIGRLLVANPRDLLAQR